MEECFDETIGDCASSQCTLWDTRAPIRGAEYPPLTASTGRHLTPGVGEPGGTVAAHAERSLLLIRDRGRPALPRQWPAFL
jgi:hypothetical protein